MLVICLTLVDTNALRLQGTGGCYFIKTFLRLLLPKTYEPHSVIQSLICFRWTLNNNIKISVWIKIVRAILIGTEQSVYGHIQKCSFPVVQSIYRRYSDCWVDKRIILTDCAPTLRRGLFLSLFLLRLTHMEDIPWVIGHVKNTF